MAPPQSRPERPQGKATSEHQYVNVQHERMVKLLEAQVKEEEYMAGAVEVDDEKQQSMMRSLDKGVDTLVIACHDMLQDPGANMIQTFTITHKERRAVRDLIKALKAEIKYRETYDTPSKKNIEQLLGARKSLIKELEAREVQDVSEVPLRESKKFINRRMRNTDSLTPTDVSSGSDLDESSEGEEWEVELQKVGSAKIDKDERVQELQRQQGLTELEKRKKTQRKQRRVRQKKETQATEVREDEDTDEVADRDDEQTEEGNQAQG